MDVLHKKGASRLIHTQLRKLSRASQLVNDAFSLIQGNASRFTAGVFMRCLC